MEYEDFCLQLIPQGEQVVAKVLTAPIGVVPEETFNLPLAVEVRRTLLGLADEEERVEIRPRAIGKELHEALFQGRIRELWRESRVLTDKRQRGLRLRLSFDLDSAGIDVVSGLPWEMLCDPETGSFLAEDIGSPVVRQLFANRARPTLAVSSPLHVLLVGAQAEEDNRISIEAEVGAIESALAELHEQGKVVIVPAEPTPEGMRDTLLDHPIHVLHLIAHGGYRPERWLGWVTMVDAEGKGRYVIGERFSAFLRGIPTLRMVVLNACSTARHGGRTANAFQGMVSGILERTGVAAVLAHQTSIGDRSAVDLSEILYRRLAQGDPVDQAVSEARLRMASKSNDWSTPVLFLNSDDGVLFRVAPRVESSDGGEAASSGRRPEREEAVLRLGVRSFLGFGDDLEEHTDHLLDLREHFDPASPDGRFIREQAWWQERVFPAVRDFLYPFRLERRRILLDLAAHASVVFAAGWVLEAKSGLEIGIRQRTQGRPLEWWPNDGRLPGEGETLWQPLEDLELAEAKADRALVVAISNGEVVKHASEFIRRSDELAIGRVLDLRIAPEPGQRAVNGGEHALLLAQGLVPRIRERRPEESSGALHLFMSGPNAFVFYLAQLSRSFGRVVLYEHPFGVPGAESCYQRSIELPPPGGGFELPADW